GIGTDAFLVGNSGSLDDIKGAVHVSGVGGNDQLILDDSGDTDANAYTIKAGSVDRAGAGPVFYARVESPAVDAGPQNDTFAVFGTSSATPVSLSLGGGNDTVTLGDATKSLDGIASTVSVAGQAGADAVVLDDSGDISPNNYVITSKDVTRN